MKKIFGIAATIGVALWAWNSDFSKDAPAPKISEGWDNFTTPTDRNAYNNIPRNPLNLHINANSPSSVIKEDRTTVMMDDASYDAVGRLVILKDPYGMVSAENTVSSCSATYAEIDGYSAIKPIILTASHCFKGSDAIESYRFVTDYIDDNGQMQRFVSHLAQAEFTKDTTKVSDTDFGVALLTAFVPHEIKPAIALVDYTYTKGQNIEVVGYSSDRQGLSTHNNATLREIYKDDILTSDGDITGGASGGPVVLKHERNRLVMVATNSAILNKSKWTIHQGITSDILDSMSFLTKTMPQYDAPVTVNHYACIKVTAEKLNIRSGPGTNFPDIGDALQGDIVNELESVSGWSKVPLQSGENGYLSQKYLTRVPCP